MLPLAATSHGQNLKAKAEASTFNARPRPLRPRPLKQAIEETKTCSIHLTGYAMYSILIAFSLRYSFIIN